MTNKKYALLFAFASFTLIGKASVSYSMEGNFVHETKCQSDTIIDGKAIQEVVVTGRDIIVKDDKLIINLSDKIKKHSHDGYSALALLNVPGLDVDPIDYIVTTNGTSTMLCINYCEVGKDEVKTINPKDIKRIDYYQTHDPKHPIANSVIDFIVKIRDHGGMVMVQANENLNKVSGDDMVDWKLYNKKSQFEIQLTDKYNHFTPNRGVESTTLLAFPSGDVEKHVMTKPSGSHSNGIGGKLSYLYKDKTSTFQAALYLQDNHNANSIVQEQTLSGIPSLTSTDYRHNDNISPSLKLYYDKRFSKKASLTVKLDASYNNTKQWRDYEAIEKYASNTKEKFYYVRPEVSFNYKPGGKVSWFAFGTYYYNHSDNTYIENDVITPNKITEGQAIIMPGCQIKFIPKKFDVVLQVQERIQTISNLNETYTKSYITPSLIYNITLSKNLRINGALFTGVNSPDMKYFNEGEKRIDEYQIIAGGSELEMGRLLSKQASLNGFYKWGGFQFFMAYNNHQKNVFEDIYCDNERKLYVHQYKNGGAYESFSTVATLDLNLIPQKLKFSGTCQYTHSKQRMGFLHTLDTWMGQTSLTYMDKGWQCKLSYNTARKSLNRAGGTFYTPQQLTLSMGYTVNNLFFNLYARNPFMTTSPKTETDRNGYSISSRSYRPRTDYNMFALRVSYRFTYGKKHRYEDVDVDKISRSAILEHDVNK